MNSKNDQDSRPDRSPFDTSGVDQHGPPDAPDDPTQIEENQGTLPTAPASATGTPSPETESNIVTEPKLPRVLHNTSLTGLHLTSNQRDEAIAIIQGSGNKVGMPIQSKSFRNLVKTELYQKGILLAPSEYKELFAQLEAVASFNGNRVRTWNRNAQLKDKIGLEIDVGDIDNTRIEITAGNVKIISRDSETVFIRSPAMMPLPMPADYGDIEPLRSLLNFSAPEFKVLVAWMTYVIAHPKVDETNYPILAIKGGQGSGKSLSVKFIADLIDPSQIGTQVFPNTAKDLAILSQNAHLLVFDNIRSFSPQMADYLCVLCSGGKLGTRALYTDSEVHIVHLHCAVILNGIHDFITQSDLAQRTLQISTSEIKRGKRISEKELKRRFDEQKSTIFRGLLDLISNIFLHINNIEITNPERMIEFTQWLAAMEKVDEAPVGTYQSYYSHLLEQAELDTLHSDPLASAMLEFTGTKHGRCWEGTPAQLLESLTKSIPESARRSYEWPKTASALSKRLRSLQASLKSQGVSIKFTRGKLRQILVAKAEENCDE